jgi:hypothetical protein
MTFLKSKEDVIDIQLTSYGKYLLMNGKFMPEYYAFFDDEIVYKQDGEQQNEIKDRLLEKTPIFNSSTNIVSKKNILNNLTEHKIKNEEEKTNFNLEYGYSDNVIPIGNSRIGTDYKPSWEFKVLKGNISNSFMYQNKSKFIMDDSQYNVYLNEPKDTMLRLVNNFSSLEMSDGSTIEIRDDYILLEITEKNVEDMRDNFEIEIFEVIDEQADTLNKLVFSEKPSNIVNGIMIEDSEMPSVEELPELSARFVQKYLDVLVDNEIDRTIIEGRTKVVEKAVEAYKTNIIPNAPTKEDPC